ncbi:MAG: glycosyltransferase [Acidobacteria bacterium]|nr:MAG: glycosyltransferase [Acidobacteriota bacterium]
MSTAFVIPVLDEAGRLPELLERLRTLEPPAAGTMPAPLVVVADGGSVDGGPQLARQAGATVVLAPRGRGSQIRAGCEAAWAAGSEVAVIVHADTRPPLDLLVHLEQALRQGAVGGGCLVRFDPAPGVLRWAAPLVNWRTRAFEVPLGDQLQWITRAAWEEIGGMQPWPILEDVDLIRRVRRVGPLAILPCEAITDARRFQRRGPLRTVARNWLIWALYAAGVSPRRLASLYRDVR